MQRTPRTLLLSVVALGSLATAAAATPSTTMPGGDQMAGLHSMMMADRGVHASMLDDPAMQADCPMLAGSMAGMHEADGDHQRHHG